MIHLNKSLMSSTIMEKIIKVLKLKQPKGEFFIGTISAEDLIDITYSDVRRIEDEEREVERYLGIQRPLDKGRVKKIKEYIQSPDASFPTGIVLSINPESAVYDQENGELILSEYTSDSESDSIPLRKIAKVLDGQHRIAAFMNDQGNYDFTLDIPDFELNIVVFIGLDLDEQANIFATINLAQTKVNKSLVYDLEGLSKVNSPFRSAHKIAVALDTVIEDSPLYHRIKRLGVKTKGRLESEPLTQAVFVESLLKLISQDPFADRTALLRGKKLKLKENEVLNLPFRSLYIDGKDEDIAVILYNYFSAIRKRWPVSWNKVTTQGNILPRSNAFKAFMRYLKDLYLDIVKEEKGRIVSKDEFYKHFVQYNIEDDDFTSGNFKPGSGGEASFYKLLKNEISIEELKE